MGVVKVNNDEVWNDYVKTGKVKGFSIEGYFIDKMERPKEPLNDFEEEEAEEMLSYIRRIVRDDKRYKDGKKEELESYSDYPDAVKNNAQRGIDLNKEINNKCATDVGKIRAQQLAQGKPISENTIKKINSYSYMKATEMLNKIKTYLGEEATDIVNDVEQSQEKVELATAKLDNGTVLEAEAFEAGKEIFIITEDDKVALPVGDYTMEDGKMLVVAEEGIIAEIKDLDEQAEVEAEEEKEEMGYVTKEELAEAVSEIKAMIEDMKKEEMSEEAEVELSEELPKEVKEELSEPAAEPIAHNPEQKNNNIGVKFAQNRKQTTLDKVMSKINN
jgi:hypothetical protein